MAPSVESKRNLNLAFAPRLALITSVVLTKNDDFLILACDGVWDVLTNDEAVNCVQKYLEENPGDMEGAAACLKEKALNNFSQDNITVIVVDLKSYVERFE